MECDRMTRSLDPLCFCAFGGVIKNPTILPRKDEARCGLIPVKGKGTLDP